jgi:hypothetical protein
VVSRPRSLLLSLAVLLLVGVIASSEASAFSEAPFWNVGEKRLSAEESATIKAGAGKEVTLHGIIGGVKVEIRCKKTTFAKGVIEGSLSEHDGKARGVFEFAECIFFAEEGGKFVEKKECTVTPFATNELSGRMFLEGTKAEGRNKLVLVFEPKEPAKEPIAEVKITGGTCTFAGTYKLEGSFGVNLKPEKEETLAVTFIFPNPAITNVWQPLAQLGEKSLAIKFAGSSASMQGEVGTESAEKVGGIGTKANPEFRWCKEVSKEKEKEAEFTDSQCLKKGAGVWVESGQSTAEQ